MKKWKKITILAIGFFLGGIINVSASNNNILGAYTFNSTTCQTGEESTCVATTCYKGSTCTAGTIIKYAVNNNETKYFYVLKDNGTTLTMQQRENTVSSVAWHETALNPDNTAGPDTALTALKTATSTWSNINLAARLITYDEAIAVGCNETECPEWMYTNLESIINGYWTNDKSSDDTMTAWAVIQGSITKANANTSYNGVRAVVVVDKDQATSDSNTGDNSSSDNNSNSGNNSNAGNTTNNNNGTSNKPSGTTNSSTNNVNKGEQVVKVGDTAKTVTIAGYSIGIFILALGIYVIYYTVRRKDA